MSKRFNNSKDSHKINKLQSSSSKATANYSELKYKERTPEEIRAEYNFLQKMSKRSINDYKFRVEDKSDTCISDKIN